MSRGRRLAGRLGAIAAPRLRHHRRPARRRAGPARVAAAMPRSRPRRRRGRLRGASDRYYQRAAGRLNSWAAAPGRAWSVSAPVLPEDRFVLASADEAGDGVPGRAARPSSAACSGTSTTPVRDVAARAPARPPADAAAAARAPLRAARVRQGPRRRHGASNGGAPGPSVDTRRGDRRDRPARAASARPTGASGTATATTSSPPRSPSARAARTTRRCWTPRSPARSGCPGSRARQSVRGHAPGDAASVAAPAARSTCSR